MTTPQPTAFTLVPRKEWKALEPLDEIPFNGIPPDVRTVFTDGETCSDKKTCIKVLKALQKQQMREGMTDIAYNFLIGGDLNVYEGRGWTTRPDSSLMAGDSYCVVVAYLGRFEAIQENVRMSDVAFEVINYGFSNGLMGDPELSKGL